MANIDIGGRLHSTATGNVVAGANEIFDDDEQKKQSQINQELRDAQEELEQSIESGLATKQDIFTVADPTITENGGQPSADASFVNNQLQLGFQNLKGDRGNGIASSSEELSKIDGGVNKHTFTDDDGTEHVFHTQNGHRGPQGETAVYDENNPPVKVATIKTTLGQSQTDTMTQKAITDALIAKWVQMPYKYINNLSMTSGVSVGDTGEYETKNSSYKYKLVYLEVNAGDIIRINFSALAGNIHGYFSSDIPAAGVTATHIYSKNFENTEVPFEFSLAMTASGYLGIVTKIETNSNMPLLYKAIMTATLASDDKNKLIATEKIDIENVDEIAYSLTSYNTWAMANDVRGKIIEITPLKKYVISCSIDAVFGLLKTNNVSAGAANLSDVYSSRLIVPGGSEVFITAPEDAHYIYLQTVNSSGVATNVAISEADGLESVVTETKETLSDVCDVMEDMLQEQYIMEPLEPTSTHLGVYLNAADGSLSEGGSSNATVRDFDLDLSKNYYVTCRNPNSSNYCGLCFMDSLGDMIEARYKGNGTSAHDIVKVPLDPPSGAVMVRVYGNSGNEEPMLFEHVSVNNTVKNLKETVNSIDENIRKYIPLDPTSVVPGKNLIADNGGYNDGGTYAMVKIYEGLDLTKTYYVTCRNPKNVGYCGLYFMDSSGNKISARYLGDGLTDAFNLIKVPLDPPEGTAAVKVFGSLKYDAEPMLYDAVGEVDLLEMKADIDSAKKLRGKKVAVIGASYSTVFGKNTPYMTILPSDVGNTIQSYVSWFDVYDKNNNPLHKTIGGVEIVESMVDGELHEFTPILEDVGKELYVARHYSGNTADIKIWSQVLCEMTGATLLANSTFSGGSINSSETIGRGQMFYGSHAWHPCSIGRCKVRDEDGNDILPDVIIIERGVNDLSYTNGDKPGGGRYPNLSIEWPDMSNGINWEDDCERETVNGEEVVTGYNFVKAYLLTIQRLRQAYPNAYIVCGTLNIFKRVIYDRYPTRNEAWSLPDLNNCIRKIADYMGCGLMELDKDGITWENMYPTYVDDSAVTPTHPNARGQRVMGERAAADLKYVLNP